MNKKVLIKVGNSKTNLQKNAKKMYNVKLSYRPIIIIIIVVGLISVMSNENLVICKLVTG